MFDMSIFDSIHDYLTSELGYDTATVRSISVTKRGELTVSFSAEDEFQANVAAAHQVHYGYFQSISENSIDDIWSRLYSWPRRTDRELTVLANQLTGITGMEEQLKSVLVQQFLAPIIAQRDELKRYLTAEPARSQTDLNDPFWSVPAAGEDFMPFPD